MPDNPEDTTAHPDDLRAPGQAPERDPLPVRHEDSGAEYGTRVIVELRAATSGLHPVQVVRAFGFRSRYLHATRVRSRPQGVDIGVETGRSVERQGVSTDDRSCSRETRKPPSR